MTTDADGNTSRTVVRTYLPAWQRDEWDEHADELDMSRSEFVKAMVQAGRNGFEGVDPPETGQTSEETAEKPSEVTAGGAEDSLEETVLAALTADSYHSWDELLTTVSNDIEDRLEDTLQRLQAADEVRYSGRHGGYTIEQ